jgi:perosamine synthetase
LHICLKLAGVQQEDEVLVPTLTFVATANAVSYCGAIPHFVDSEEATLGLDPGKLSDYLAKITNVRPDGCINKRTGRRIKAVVPMHTFGHPVDLDPLVELCRNYRLVLIEDAAESLGSCYKKKHTGNFGATAALSFNGNKVITTGGGGAILTNDELLAKQAKHLVTTARVPHQWSFLHDAVGYNYRMPNINAALGCAQLEKLPEFLGKKRRLAEKYKKVFNSIDGISFFSEPEFAHSNYWLNVLLLDDENSITRDTLLQGFHEKGIMARPAWTPMHRLSMYQHCPRMDLAVAESLEKRIINIPSSAVLGTSNA